MDYVFDKNGILELEALISKKGSCTTYDLMSLAATGCSHFIRDYWPNLKKITVICGPGKNGGDGYLIAHDLLVRKYDVSILSTVDPSKLNGDTKRASEKFLSSGGKISVIDDKIKIAGDLIVDAIFGIGLSRPLSGLYKNIVQHINNLPIPVCSVDMPSGLDPNTGIAENGAVIANATVTFIAHKIGLLIGDAKSYMGFLHLDELNYDVSSIPGAKRVADLLFFDDMLDKRPYRLPTVHKNQVGQVAVVGGGSNLGAVLLAAQAAYRVGAGRVEVFTTPEHASLVPLSQPEVISHGINNSDELAIKLNRFDTIIVGPGLGVDNWARSCLSAVLSARKPMVVDADALYLLPSISGIRFHYNDVVLTPHVGEAHYLLQESVNDIYNNLLHSVKEISSRYNVTALLKGASSLISSDVSVSVSTYGSSGMAVAGMGDLLSGIIGGLIAQGLGAYDAACLGVVLHAVAGEIKYESLGNGLMPTDLLDEIAGLLVGSSDEI